MKSTGEIMIDLPSCAGNPRNSEGDFITLKDGSILFVYSKYVDSEDFKDDGKANLVALRSRDGGISWGEERTLVRAEDENAKNVMSVSLLRRQNGEILLFYLYKREGGCAPCYRISADEGESWGPSVPVWPEGGKICSINNSRLVRLSSGRIVAPASWRDPHTGERGIRFLLSDDDGLTWAPSEACVKMPYKNHADAVLQEPGVIELKDGRLWAFMRTELGYQYESYSEDAGITWSAAEPSCFTSPLAPLTMARLPDGRLIAVWNPIPNYNTRYVTPHGRGWNGGRTPLAMATSADEGRTWENHLLLETQPNAGYCYTAIHFTPTAMLLGYCAGDSRDYNCLCRLRIRRILLENID